MQGAIVRIPSREGVGPPPCELAPKVVKGPLNDRLSLSAGARGLPQRLERLEERGDLFRVRLGRVSFSSAIDSTMTSLSSYTRKPSG